MLHLRAFPSGLYLTIRKIVPLALSLLFWTLLGLYRKIDHPLLRMFWTDTERLDHNRVLSAIRSTPR